MSVQKQPDILKPDDAAGSRRWTNMLRWCIKVADALNAVRTEDRGNLTTDASGFATLSFQEQQGYIEKPLVFPSVEGDGNYVNISTLSPNAAGRYTSVTVFVQDNAGVAVVGATVHIKAEKA